MTTIEAADWLNSKLSFGRGGLEIWGAKFKAIGLIDELRISFNFTKVPHRDTGKVDGGLTTTCSIDVLVLLSLNREKAETFVLAEVLSFFRNMMLHELHECLLWEGKRRWDPHAGEV